MPTGGSTDLQTALKVATDRDRIAEDEPLQLAAHLKGGAQHLQHPVLGIGRGREVRDLRHQPVSSGPRHSTVRIFLVDKFKLCIAMGEDYSFKISLLTGPFIVLILF